MKKGFLIVIFSCFTFCFSFAQNETPKPVLPIPTENQLHWQQMEYYGFIHYSVNTYTDEAWGFGNEDPKIFNPDKLDVRQWARICKEAGMKGVIFTAKHHSGFCLWPSKYTDYSVKNAPWKNGQGDMVKELADACKEFGLKFGVYLSPWDRNHPDYGKPEYITYFRNQLTELLTNYGEIFEVWFDGANGGNGYYGGANENRKIDAKTYYDWQNTYKLVRKLQPNIVIWNDGGDRADLRWVGTESGYVGETNWSLLNATGDVPEDMLRHGVENGNAWVPGEVNTSIRPEWFYHPKEDKKVKTLPQLMDTYYNSVGRNGTLLLNFPIMPNGLIHETDEKNVLDFAKARKEAFGKNLLKNTKIQASNVRAKSSQFSAQKAIDNDAKTYWATDDALTSGSLTVIFTKPTSFNRFLVQEPIQLGQRVKAFTLEANINGKWQKIAIETTIGYKRILRFKTIIATQIRLNITDAKACPLISNMEVYQTPIILRPPMISRNQNGDVHISQTDAESEVFYTLDGSLPTSKSFKYTTAVPSNLGKLTVKAISFNPQNNLSSAVAEVSFDIARKNWTIVAEQDKNALKVLDGNEYTSWQKYKAPTELTIDLGKVENLVGFRYLSDQNWWADASIISHYQFFVSDDGSTWKLMSEGEFSNIKNNPTWQIKSFEQTKARFIKLKALKNIKENSNSGYAEIDILTK